MENNLIDKLFLDDIKDIKEVIDGGVDVNVKNKEGKTALIKQSFFGNFNNVKFLLDSGADINTTNDDGESALDVARNRYEENKDLVISILLKNNHD